MAVDEVRARRDDGQTRRDHGPRRARRRRPVRHGGPEKGRRRAPCACRRGSYETSQPSPSPRSIWQTRLGFPQTRPAAAGLARRRCAVRPDGFFYPRGPCDVVLYDDIFSWLLLHPVARAGRAEGDGAAVCVMVLPRARTTRSDLIRNGRERKNITYIRKPAAAADGIVWYYFNNDYSLLWQQQ